MYRAFGLFHVLERSAAMLYYCVLLDLCDFKDPRAIISEFSRQKYSVSEGVPELVENPNTSRTPWRVQYAIRRENEGLQARTSIHMSSQIAHLASQNTEVTRRTMRRCRHR